MSIEVKPECIGCPRLELSLQAIAKGKELLHFSELVREDAEEVSAMAHSADQVEYWAEDGSLIPWGEAMGYHRMAEKRFEEARDIEAGGEALMRLGETAIVECQNGCPGALTLKYVDRKICQGNTGSPSLKALISDYGEGGLELNDATPASAMDAIAEELKAMADRSNEIDKT